MKKTLIIIAGTLVSILVMYVGWWLLSPLFINQSVQEAFPAGLPNQSELADMFPEEAEKILENAMQVIDEEYVASLTSDEANALENEIMTIAKMAPDHPMDDEMPETDTESEWVLITQGQFQDADNLHKGSGTASIFQNADQRVLRFEEFQVTNGPDLHVLLVENVFAANHDEIGNYVDLGKLKGNLGSQNYEIASDVDLSQYQGVMIYCVPFKVVFATAAFEN